MATVFINYNFKESGLNWQRKAGATRHELGIIIDHRISIIENNKPIIAKLGFQTKGGQSLIIITPSNNNDKILGVYLNDYYGFTCHNKEEKEIFAADSISACKWYKMGIYREGAILGIFSYKRRNPSSYTILTENGWRYLGTKNDIVAKATEGDQDALTVARVRGFLEMEEIE